MLALRLSVLSVCLSQVGGLTNGYWIWFLAHRLSSTYPRCECDLRKFGFPQNKSRLLFPRNLVPDTGLTKNITASTSTVASAVSLVRPTFVVTFVHGVSTFVYNTMDWA